jgi:hypothetical protein
MPLWMTSEEHQASEIEGFPPRKAKIVQHLSQRSTGLVECLIQGLSILLLEESAKVLQVDVCRRGTINRHLIRMKEISTLKHSLNFVAGCHAGFVRS